jgi:hypothetical protein
MVISSPSSLRKAHLIVPVPAMVSPLLMPFRTVDDEGAKVMKSSLLLLIQQLAPVSIQTGLSLENFRRRVLEA